MYKIIGADRKEYGPVTADQVRQWISDGRATAQTQARADGTEEWKPLSAFPEFADAFGVSPGAAAPMSGSVPTPPGKTPAPQAVKGPAIGLMVAAVLGLVIALVNIVTSLMGQTVPNIGDERFQEIFEKVGPTATLVSAAVNIIVALVILAGAMKMMRLQNYQLAMTAAILALIPCMTHCCGWIIAVPFAIWALVVLMRPDVKAQFS